MRTAVEYSGSIDKKAAAGLAYKAFQGVTNAASKMFGKQTGVSMIKAKNKLKAMKTSAGTSASKHYNSYKKGSLHKSYGNKPLYAAGAVGALGAGSALSSPNKGTGVQINLPESRQIRI